MILDGHVGYYPGIFHTISFEFGIVSEEKTKLSVQTDAHLHTPYHAISSPWQAGEHGLNSEWTEIYLPISLWVQ